MSRAIGVLLEIWHSAFYRYEPFDLAAHTSCVAKHPPVLEKLRPRTIQSLSKQDEPTIRDLFWAFTVALRGGKRGTAESTVAAAVADYVDTPDDCTLLKRIDEFAYAVHTRHWVSLSGAGADRD